MEEKIWKKNEVMGNYILDDKAGKVFLSYQPNDQFNFGLPELDSSNPETAVVLIADKKVEWKKEPVNRYLIFRGDRRKELEELYPDIEKLKEFWKKEGGHFWSDGLDEETNGELSEGTERVE